MKEFVKSNFLFNQMINIFVGVTFLYDSFNIKAQKMQIQHIPGQDIKVCAKGGILRRQDKKVIS